MEHHSCLQFPLTHPQPGGDGGAAAMGGDGGGGGGGE
jgi:hypothetical protein